MNTTYFLNCAAGNLFGTKVSHGIPESYYIGLSTTAPNIRCISVNLVAGLSFGRPVFHC